ncbi:TlpA family protein disulfide reductase [Kaistella rhinocerotis]|uniref:TlpA family protein disulfide reductase n=1 Tax=Kaistella rhinocerotis TaxID=3026437 RepID=UPI00255548E2|nr:thioredoxin-like domain-containing protein [Kaistella sp. Ran72]
MKKILQIFVLLMATCVFAQKIPKTSKTEFSKESLAQKITSQNGKKITVADVIKKHEGKILIIDFWASWCQDCILALPETKKLKENNPEIEFVYFSLDRSHAQWEKGLAKYGIEAEENYWFDEGWKNSFNNFIELNWVPRFIVVDQNGKIANYYAVSPADSEMRETIEKLKSKTN